LANPIPPPLIWVNSPQNYKIYSSNEVELNITVIPDTSISLTSFSFSLDGQETQATNGSTTLTNLSYGSHTLEIYGNNTYSYSTLAIVYFSTVYSTSWVVFTIVLVATVSIVLLLLLKKRRQIVAALKGKKTAGFWTGLVCFVFFAILFFIPAIWIAASDYLFPHYPNSLSTNIYPNSGILIGLIFMCTGLYLMRRGTKKPKP
jgi:hypothetical protein